MPRNGSGSYSLPAGNPVVTGTTISSTVQNNTTSDIAAALTGSLAADGQTAWAGNQNANGNRLTSLANASSAQDAVTLAQFANALGASGYQKLPSGLLIQWGALTTSASADVNTSFTISFTTLYTVILTAANGGGGSSNSSVSVGAVSAASFNTGAYQANTGSRIATAVYYVALGLA